MHIDKNILISVIIPVYNVSKYLRRCLDSCVFQTLQDIEIIVVNDCSPDANDTAIMEMYREAYPEKIRLEYHDENRGLGGARNTGVKLARGKYVIFVDSDDYLDINFCEKCYDCAKNENSDIVLTYAYICPIGESVKINRRDNIKLKFIQNIYPAWALLIKKDLIVKSNLWFPEKLYHEDTAVTPLWQAIADKISVIAEPLYYYMKGRTGSITSLEFESRVEAMFKAFDWLLENTSRFPQYFDLMLFYFYEYFSNRLIEIKNISTFKLFASCFCDISEKYNLNIESLSVQRKQIFGLFLKVATDQLWEETYDEYLTLIRKHYLISCSTTDLRNIFGSKNPETVCVWGCGNYGTQLLEKFEEMGFKCMATDMSISKIGTVMPNGSIVKPWNEVKDNVKTLIVGVAGKFQEISNLVDSNVEVFAVNG